jgi:hypothetical protein
MGSISKLRQSRLYQMMNDFDLLYSTLLYFTWISSVVAGTCIYEYMISGIPQGSWWSATWSSGFIDNYYCTSTTTRAWLYRNSSCKCPGIYFYLFFDFLNMLDESWTKYRHSCRYIKIDLSDSDLIWQRRNQNERATIKVAVFIDWKFSIQTEFNKIFRSLIWDKEEITEKIKFDNRGQEMQTTQKRIFSRWYCVFKAGQDDTKQIIQQIAFMPLDR